MCLVNKYKRRSRRWEESLFVGRFLGKKITTGEEVCGTTGILQQSPATHNESFGLDFTCRGYNNVETSGLSPKAIHQE